MVLTGDVFTTAMNLMDEQSEDGTYDGYPQEYKDKSWPILTLLQAELLSSNVTPPILTSNEDSFIIDDRLALTALPYGLAAHLLMNEDESKASFFNSRFDELKVKKPDVALEIEEVYSFNPLE